MRSAFQDSLYKPMTNLAPVFSEYHDRRKSGNAQDQSFPDYHDDCLLQDGPFGIMGEAGFGQVAIPDDGRYP
jgi:hypothetical protein